MFELSIGYIHSNCLARPQSFCDNECEYRFKCATTYLYNEVKKIRDRGYKYPIEERWKDYLNRRRKIKALIAKMEKLGETI